MERKSWYIECTTILIWSNNKSKLSKTFLIWSNNHKNQLKLHKVNLSKYLFSYIVYYLYYCTTLRITIIIDILLYTRRIDIQYTRIIWNHNIFVKQNQFRISKMMAIECVTKDWTCIYFKCNGNIKWTIVVIFLSIIFLIVNSYSLESIEH